MALSGASLFSLVRSIVYASLFIGFVLLYIPSLIKNGLENRMEIKALQVGGLVIGALGAGLILWCIFNFSLVGRGTPAPFDPPRKLVIHGPYRFVRNPMYLGAALVLTGEALYFNSLNLLAYAGIFFLIMHLFVVLYEEPTLRQTFHDEYEAYCRKVNRWRPDKPLAN